MKWQYLAVFVVLFVSGCIQIGIVKQNGQYNRTCDVMILDSEGPYAGGEYSEGLGTNTIPYFMGHNWKVAEKEKDSFDWDSIFFEDNDYNYTVLRIGILHIMAWSASDLPDWIDIENETQLKKEYAGYITAMMQQLKQRNITIDLFLVELECNVAGINMGWNNTKIIDWLEWETDLIKSINPKAKICIPLTPMELRPNTNITHNNDYREISEIEFAQRMDGEGVDFEVAGFNIASGPYDNICNWTVLRDYLKKWDAVDKELFVWNMGYPAHNNDNLPYEYPCNYSGEWQDDMYVNSLRILLNDSRIIGITIALYDYLEYGWGAPFAWGLVAGNKTELITLNPRESFYSVKEILENNC